MGPRVTRIALAAAMAAALPAPPLVIEACGPDLSPPTFTDPHAPDEPSETYARGALGLLEPGFHHIYLYAAYRNLAGKPLDDTELATMKAVVARGGYAGAAEAAASGPAPGNVSVNWQNRWQAERARVLGNSSRAGDGYYDAIGVVRNVRANGQYFGYYNCLSGAFQYAVQSLDQLIAQFGADSPFVKQWLAAQDAVFANCAGPYGYPRGPATAVIPAAAAATDPQQIREDRAYQIAAAHFYAGEFEQARAGFAAIAQDPASPHRRMASYLVARCLVREGTLAQRMDTADSAPLPQAERQLEAILASPDLAELHPAARGLLEYVNIRLRPREREKQLETILGGGQRETGSSQDLVDYLWLLDHSVSAAQQPATAAATPGAGGMSDWIVTFSDSGPRAFAHSLELWRQTQGLPWLVTAISQAAASDPAAPTLIAAAESVPRDSPAYVTVTLHRLRLLAQGGQAAEARRGLDAALASRQPALSRAARNQFLALRMTVSTSLEDWLAQAARHPVDLGGYEYVAMGKRPKDTELAFFDSDASVTLTEKLPLQALVDAAHSTELPAGLRRQVAVAAWTRAILLGDDSAAERVAPVLATLTPELRSGLANYEAASGGRKKFTATLLLLGYPGMRPFVPAGVARWSFEKGPELLDQIDEFRDNWWCGMGPPPNGMWPGINYYTLGTTLSAPLNEIYPDGKISDPGFLSPSERAAARSQLSELVKLPSAPDWMGQQTLVWAKAHPDDPQVPASLYLVVRATRYGCQDTATAGYSKQAFLMLHSRYRASPWTKKTPYWYR